MLRIITILALVAVTTAGCASISESRLNPFNWGSGAEPTAIDPATGQPVINRANLRPLVPPGRVTQTVDGRPLVAEVSQLEVTPTLGGVVVRATGRAATAGAFSAELTLVEATRAGIILDMRAFQQSGSGGGIVTVARFFSTGELGNARTITVRAAGNSLSRRR